MPLTSGVLINGVNYSWSNVKLVLFGIPVVGITSINYGKRQDKTNNYGFGAEPVSRGYGRIEYEGSIEIYKDEWVRICNAAPNNDALQIAPFTITVLYGSAPSQGAGVVVPTVDKLYNCEFTEDMLSTNEGDSSIKMTIPIVFAGLEHTV